MPVPRDRARITRSASGLDLAPCAHSCVSASEDKRGRNPDRAAVAHGRADSNPRAGVEVMWLTGRLVPDHKTIADFRKDNGRAIRQVCSRFIVLCRTMGLFAE